MAYELKVPYKKDGGLWYAVPAGYHPNLEWGPVKQFDAEMQIVSEQSTVNGNFFLWKDVATNSTWPMSPKELLNALQSAVVEDGFIEGTWDVVKYNQRFSLRLVAEKYNP